MKEKLLAVWDWIVVSSANPENTSLTVKGLAVGVLPYVLQFLPLVGVHPTGDLRDVPNALYTVVDSSLVLVAVGMTLFGAIRKIVFLFIPE